MPVRVPGWVRLKDAGEFVEHILLRLKIKAKEWCPKKEYIHKHWEPEGLPGKRLQDPSYSLKELFGLQIKPL